MTQARFTARQKAACAQREVSQRKRVYPRWVEAGRMKLQQAEQQIAMMEEIAREYAEKADAEEATQRLL